MCKQNPGKKNESDANHEQDSDHSDESESSYSSSAIETEDEEVSEYSEEDCSRMKQVYAQRISELESRILSVQEQIYKEKICICESKKTQILKDISLEYLTRVDDLNGKKKSKLEIAGASKGLKLGSIEKQNDAQMQSLRQTYEDEVKNLFDRIRDEIENKIIDVEEECADKNKLINKWLTDKSNISDKESKKQSSKQRDLEEHFVPRKKPVLTNGPFIVYQLKRNEIMEDVKLVRQAIFEQGRRQKQIVFRQRFKNEFKIEPNFTPNIPGFLLATRSSQKKNFE